MARMIACLCLVSLCAAAAAAEPLKGKWQAVKGTRDGRPLSKEELARFKLILGEKGGRTGWQDPFMGASDPFHNLGITFDRAATPSRLYLTRLAGLKATTYPAIFKLEGERLTVCWNLEPWTCADGPVLRPVPKEFAAPRRSGFTLLTFEKARE
jgi:uncharacterized protein (TIGR03067 family)